MVYGCRKEVVDNTDFINQRQRDIKKIILMLVSAARQSYNIKDKWSVYATAALPGLPGQSIVFHAEHSGGGDIVELHNGEYHSYLYDSRQASNGVASYREPSYKMVLGIWGSLPELVSLLQEQSPGIRQDLIFWQNVGRTQSVS